MKKIYLYLILLIIFIPSKIWAISINDVRIIGADEKEIGDDISLSFFIDYNDIKKDSINSKGIANALLELEYDDEILSIKDIDPVKETSSFNSLVYKENNKYYLYGEVSTNDPYKNKCLDGILYCGNYNVTILFHINETDKTNTVIKINEVKTGTINLLDTDKEYKDTDISYINYNNKTYHEIKLIKNNKDNQKESNKINISNKPTDIINRIITNHKNNLKDKDEITYIEIKDYSIDFNKYIYDYSIKVPENTNKLDINVVTINDNSNYKITGADNLKDNHYKVRIEMNDKVYNINVILDTDKTKETIYIENMPSKKDKIISYIKKNKDNIIIGALSILLLIIICIIISKRKDKKINKLLGDL